MRCVPVDFQALLTITDRSEPAMEVDCPLSFRDFPWRWRDVLIGYLPFLLGPAFVVPMRHVLQNAPGWAWIASSYASGLWMFAYPVYVVWKRAGFPRWPRPRKMIVQTLLAIPLVVIAFVIVAVVISGVTGLLGNSARGDSPTDAMLYSTNRLQWIFLYALGVVVAPLGEEPFHRGMLFSALRQRMHWTLAAVLVSVVFALFHPYGLADRAGVFVLGLFLAGFYEWRKTLFAPMVFHALTNSYALTVAFFMAVAFANSPMIGLATEGRDDGCLVILLEPGGPAEKAGIKIGDIVTEMDVYSVRERRHIFSIMQMHKAGDTIHVKYLRDGKEFTAQVTLKERPK
jgi:membrane protease YdiL (CAAX protease family)